MTPKDRLIERFKALCKRHGVDVIAREIRANVDNLKQIIAGTKLPSGAPRGVGPTLQRKLEAKYPNWADSDIPRAPGKKFEDRHEVNESDWATLQAVKTVLSDKELTEIRERAAEIERRVEERLAQVKRRV